MTQDTCLQVSLQVHQISHTAETKCYTQYEIYKYWNLLTINSSTDRGKVAE